MILTYKDGTQVTTRQLALKVLAEGRLITRYLVSTTGRCAEGVIVDSTLQDFTPEGSERELSNESRDRLRDGLGGYPLSHLNDDFKGTPEERCIYIATLLRDLPLDPEELDEADTAVATEPAIAP